MVWPVDIAPFLREERRFLLDAEQAQPVDEFVQIHPATWEEFGRDQHPLLESREFSVVYVFVEVGGQPEVTFEAFEAAKLRLKTGPDARQFPKTNRVHIGSRVLYVGSCRENFPKRLREHLGEGAKSTSGLNLRHWFGECQFRLSVRRYDVDAQVLQKIEDGFSFSLRPLFGKRGSNGR